MSPEYGPSIQICPATAGKTAAADFQLSHGSLRTSMYVQLQRSKEYVLIVEDPDAPLPNPIAHGVY